MKKVLITGVAGFIGSNTAEALLKEKGIKVIGIDNYDTNYSVAYKKENVRLLETNKRFTFYKADIRNQKKLAEIFKKEKPDAVLHLAAKADTRHAVVAPTEYITTNVNGTLNMLECAKDTKVRRFVFASSSSVYGNKNKAPYKETASTDFSISPYGASKKAGEILAYTYQHNFKLPVICVRIFNAYGPRMRPKLVMYTWVEKLLNGESIEISGKGVRARDYTYIGDLVDGLIKALKNETIDFDIINIGSSTPVPLKKLVKVVEQATGVKAVVVERPSTHPSVEKTHASNVHAKAVLDWEPTTSIEDGVLAFVEWFRANRLKKTKQSR